MNSSRIYLWLVISALLGLCGSIFFWYQQSWIIITWPHASDKPLNSVISQVKPRQVALWAYKPQGWVHETIDIIPTDDLVQTVQLLLNGWLQLLEEEHIIDVQIIAQSVAISQSKQELFISLSQSPLAPQASTYDACMLIESMLKTLRVNQINVPNIRLLVHHQPLVDDRLNFAHAWPIAGYLKVT